MENQVVNVQAFAIEIGWLIGVVCQLQEQNVQLIQVLTEMKEQK